RLRERSHEHRLAKTRHAFEQRVRAREHAREHAIDDLAITHDDSSDFLSQLPDLLLKVFDFLAGCLCFTHAVYSPSACLSASSYNLDRLARHPPLENASPE